MHLTPSTAPCLPAASRRCSLPPPCGAAAVRRLRRPVPRRRHLQHHLPVGARPGPGQVFTGGCMQLRHAAFLGRVLLRLATAAGGLSRRRVSCNAVHAGLAAAPGGFLLRGSRRVSSRRTEQEAHVVQRCACCGWFLPRWDSPPVPACLHPPSLPPPPCLHQSCTLLCLPPPPPRTPTPPHPRRSAPRRCAATATATAEPASAACRSATVCRGAAASPAPWQVAKSVPTGWPPVAPALSAGCCGLTAPARSATRAATPAIASRMAPAPSAPRAGGSSKGSASR